MAEAIQHGMVLAAGLGTRMRPITNTIPKPLVQVAGRSILDRNIDALHKLDVSNVVVNGHYLFPKMRDHIQAWGDDKITLVSEEQELLDQGGGIKNALDHLGGGDFFVLNGDAFWLDGAQPNLQLLLNAWRPDEMDFLLMVCPVEKTTGYDGAGDFYLSDDDQISFRGTRDSAPYVFTGVGIYKSGIFRQTEDRIFPLVPMYKQSIEKGRLFGVVMDGHWFHIGTPPAIELAEAKLKELGQPAYE